MGAGTPDPLDDIILTDPEREPLPLDRDILTGGGVGLINSTTAKDALVVDRENILDGINSDTDPLRRDYSAVWKYAVQDRDTVIRWARDDIESLSDTSPLINVRTVAGTARFIGPDRESFLGRYEQTFMVFGRESRFANLPSWFEYCLNNYPLGTTYLDHALEYNEPFTPLEEFYLNGNVPNIAVARTRYDYNFYTKQYENIIENVRESLYPDIYVFYLEKGREPAPGEGRFLNEQYEINPLLVPDLLQPGYNEDFLYSDFITLDRTVPGVFINSLRTTDPSSEKVGERDTAEYYDRWSYFYPIAAAGVPVFNPNSGEVLAELSSRFGNIIVPRTTQGLMQSSFNSYKELFPMFSELEYPQMEPANLLNSSGLENYAFNNIMRDYVADSQQLERVQAGIDTKNPEYIFQRQFVETHQRVDETGRRYTFTEGGISPTTRRVFDFQEWIRSFGDIDPTIVSEADSVFLKNFEPDSIDDQPYPTRPETSPPGVVDPGLSSDIGQIINVVAEMVEDNLRKQGELFTGVRAYSEDLFYRVDKYLVNEVGNRSNQPIKSYFLLNTPKNHTRINLIDTQLKYNQSYQYDIKTCRIVIGSETEYTTGEALLWEGGDYVTPEPTDTLRGEFRPFDLYSPSETDSGDEEGVITTGTSPSLPSGPDVEVAGTSPSLPTGPTSADAGAFFPEEFGGEGIATRGSFTPGTARGVPVGDVSDPAVLSGVIFRDTDPWTPYVARFNVKIKPSVKIIELPFARNYQDDTSFGRGTMLDDPPMPPEVEVVPYRGVDFQILLLMNTGAGADELEPVIFSPEEQLYVLRLQQMVVDPNQTKILFENDDPSTQFEVYRMETKPFGYEDFSDNLRATIRTESEQNGFKPASSAALRDLIEPNKKYYYMFRALDIHGHSSYPSPVYEVELVNNDGAIYPVVRVVEFETADATKVATKKVNRFLQISPTLLQTQLNERSLEVANDGPLSRAPNRTELPLGVEEEKIWGKKFKIRVTSKKTGKKIDLNVKFDKEYDPTVLAEVELSGPAPAFSGGTTTTTVTPAGTIPLPGSTSGS
jgi:hypothetical protein